MIKLIVGGKGKGKTKILLDEANKAIKEANGNIVYIDASSKHMYELNNKVRLIDASNLPLKNSDQFLGAISGVLSQDRDIEKIFLDNFLKLAKVDEDSLNDCLKECANISDTFGTELIIGVSAEKEKLSEELRANIVLEL